MSAFAEENTVFEKLPEGWRKALIQHTERLKKVREAKDKIATELKARDVVTERRAIDVVRRRVDVLQSNIKQAMQLLSRIQDRVQNELRAKNAADRIKMRVEKPSDFAQGRGETPPSDYARYKLRDFHMRKSSLARQIVELGRYIESSLNAKPENRPSTLRAELIVFA